MDNRVRTTALMKLKAEKRRNQFPSGHRRCRAICQNEGSTSTKPRALPALCLPESCKPKAWLLASLQ